MGKKTLTESFVQHTVAERLNKDYYRRRSAYVATEAYTRLKRADVFLSFFRTRGQPYVVVVEAKSRTTIHQLKLKEAPGQVRWASYLVTAALIVGLSAALGYQWYFNAVNTLLLLALFLLGSGLISAVISRLALSVLGSISAIEQLGRYPANEKWIAVGEDTFARPADYQTLYRQCKKNGIGLLVVTAKGKMHRRLIPEPRHTFNDYLGSYGKKAEMLSVMSKSPAYGPTPPERAKRWRQMTNAASLLAVVGLLALIAYEENNRPVIPDPFAEPHPTALASEIVSPIHTDSIFQEGAAAGAERLEKEQGSRPPLGCQALSITSRAFLVVDALLTEDKVPARLEELRQAKITDFRAIPTDCLNSWPAPGRYAIYKDSVFSSRPAASRVAKAHKAALEEAGLPFKYGNVVKVRPGK